MEPTTHRPRSQSVYTGAAAFISVSKPAQPTSAITSTTDCRFCGAAANVSCRACGLFCGTCDAVYHTVPSRAAHVREAVITAAVDAPTQEEAENDESAAQKAAPTIYCDDDMVEFATVFCTDCERHFCASCDTVLHMGADTKSHTRKLIAIAVAPAKKQGVVAAAKDENVSFAENRVVESISSQSAARKQRSQSCMMLSPPPHPFTATAASSVHFVSQSRSILGDCSLQLPAAQSTMPEDDIMTFAASTGAHCQELDSAARDFDFNLELDDAPIRMASTNHTVAIASAQSPLPQSEPAVSAPELLSPSHPRKPKQPTSQRKLSVLGALGLGMNMGIGPKIMLQHMRHQQNQQNQQNPQNQQRAQCVGMDSAPFASPLIGRGRSASMAFPSSSSSSSALSSFTSSSSSSVLSPLGKRFRAQSVFAADFPAHLDTSAAAEGMLSAGAADTAALTPTAAVLRQQQVQLQYLEQLQLQLRSQWRATAAAVAANESNVHLSQGSATHAVGERGMAGSVENEECGESSQLHQQQSHLSPDELAAEQACLSSTGGEPWRRVSRPGAHLFKLLVVGNSKCGKSSLIQRYTRDAFSENYAVTVGSDFSRKQLQWDEETSIRVNLWDVAGQDRFATLTRPFFAGAVGAIVVCDVTRPASLDAAKMWKLELDDRLADCRVPVILVANKSDLLQGGTKSFATGARVAKLAQDCGFAGWFVASAKENANITLGVEFLLNEVLRAQQQVGDEYENVAMSQQSSATIDLTALPPAAVSSYGCC